MSSFSVWQSAVTGVGLDIDRVEGNQCVDVAKSWAQVCFPNVPWTITLGYGNAKDIFNNANPAYFEKIANDHSNPNQLPVQGDIAVFGPSPKAGYTATIQNPFGHVGIVKSADSGGILLIQQDGSNPSGKTFERYRPWKYTECYGWLRPKSSANNPPAESHVETVSPGTWNVRTGPSMGAGKRDGVALGGQKYDTVVVEGGWRKIMFRNAVGYVGPAAWR